MLLSYANAGYFDTLIFSINVNPFFRGINVLLEQSVFLVYRSVAVGCFECVHFILPVKVKYTYIKE